MEGIKERERERGEEKESDDMEEEEEDIEGAALDWQKGHYPEDELGLPIMHWEALSLRIADLERQEEQREKEGLGRRPDWTKQHQDLGIHRVPCEDEDGPNSRVTALTSRFQSHMNLQLCFINDSDSEEEERQTETNQRAGMASGQSTSQNVLSKSKPTGFKMEVKAALSALRDKLWTEQKQAKSSDHLSSIKRIPLGSGELQKLSIKELNALQTSLSRDIHDLSSELVTRLQTRDQLRTEQDAMLLEVQDMTSL